MSHHSSWPGERHPSDRDVELGFESLDAAFLQRFSSELETSAAASSTEALMTTRLEVQTSSPVGFSYPLSSLYNVPHLPSDETLSMLQHSFAYRFQSLPFVNTLPLPPPLTEPVPPFFKLALACLASTDASKRGPNETPQLCTDLFFASMSLWTVMLELDNREARTIESVLSPVLLSIFGHLTADVEVWSMVEQRLLPPACTVGASSSTTRSLILQVQIARRLRLSQLVSPNDTETSPLVATGRSSVLALLFITGTFAAIHMNIPLYMTSAELDRLIDWEGRVVEFDQLYRSLANDARLPEPTNFQHVDPMLLLTAILSDVVAVRRSLVLGRQTGALHELSHEETPRLPTRSDHPPDPVLSSASESERMIESLSESLDKWYLMFASGSRQHLSLFYFCKLYLACPEIDWLPNAAGYPPGKSQQYEAISMPLHGISISGAAVDYSWEILEHNDTTDTTVQTYCPIWRPLVVFLAALVIWAKIQQDSRQGRIGGRLKQLRAFRLELDQMSWPCCHEMSFVLDRLMDPQVARIAQV